MKKNNNRFSFAIITVGLILLVVPLAFPIEGGLFFIAAAIGWLGFQVWRYSSFYISKAFIFFFLLIIYLLIFAQFSRTIPITHIFIQRVLIFLLLAFFLYSSLRSVSDRIPWENALIVLAIIVSVWSIVEIGDWYRRYIPTISALQVLGDLQVSYRVGGSLFGHPNPLAGFLNFVWPIVFIRLYQSKQTLNKFIWAALLLLFATTIFYTNSRGALLGTLGSLLVIIFIYMLGKIFRYKSSFAAKYKQSIAIIIGSVGGIFFLALGIIWRTQFTGQSISRSFSGRGTIWKYSWDAFLENSIFGQGIATFPISYTRLAQLPPGDTAPSAHNLWLQAGVDYGIIGFVFVCILMIVFVYFGGKKIWDELSEQPLFYLAYLVGGIAFLLQQMIDYMLVTTSYLVIFLLILVLMTKYGLQIGEWKLNRKSYIVVSTIIISLLISYQFIVNSKTMSLGERTSLSSLASDEQWYKSHQKICLYTEKFPENALYKFECGLAISQQIFHQLPNNDIDENLLEEAVKYQQSGFDQNPYWLTQEANLAVLYWAKGDNHSALKYMKQTANAAPMYGLFWLNYGWMEEQMDNRGAALNAYTRALRINPMINRSSFIQQSAFISEAVEDLEEWLQAEDLWDDWYGRNRHDRSKYDKNFWRGVIALSVGQTDLAVKSFETSLEKGSNSASLYAHLAYAYDLAGQTELAYSIAQDFALLRNNHIRSTKNPTDLSMIASILRKNGDADLAYDQLLSAYQNEQELIIYSKYYPQIYNQQILRSDISPWLVRSQLILVDTQDDWHWLAEETLRRGNVQLSENISIWLKQSSGVATLIQNK